MDIEFLYNQLRTYLDQQQASDRSYQRKVQSSRLLSLQRLASPQQSPIFLVPAAVFKMIEMKIVLKQPI